MQLLLLFPVVADHLFSEANFSIAKADCLIGIRVRTDWAHSVCPAVTPCSVPQTAAAALNNFHTICLWAAAQDGGRSWIAVKDQIVLKHCQLLDSFEWNGSAVPSGPVSPRGWFRMK